MGLTVKTQSGKKLGNFINKYGNSPGFIILAFLPMIPLALISMIINLFYDSIWFCNVWGGIKLQ